MPRKEGSECLKEIKSNTGIKEFPIVIYSTCSEDSMADELYKNGAYYCMKKGDLSDLAISLQFLLQLLVEKNSRDLQENISLFFIQRSMQILKYNYLANV